MERKVIRAIVELRQELKIPTEGLLKEISQGNAIFTLVSVSSSTICYLLSEKKCCLEMLGALDSMSVSTKSR